MHEPTFITVFVFLIICFFGFGPYKRRLSPIQVSVADKMRKLNNLIHEADLGMKEHKKHTQLHKMHRDNKTKLRTEMLTMENNNG